LIDAAAAGERELLARARDLGGRTLAEIAARLERALPSDPARHKGAAGALIERALGATAGTRAAPDFESIGVELKTLPIDARGAPKESTFVCCASRDAETDWARSSVRRKLARVLWVPIEASAPYPRRRVGSAFLWSPDAALESILRADWEELGDHVAASPERVSARLGRALQLRPKAPNGAARAHRVDGEGAPVLAMPRAFYLRRSFTRAILESAGLGSVSCSAAPR
jgi:DNA mismatch repair protein MutH